MANINTRQLIDFFNEVLRQNGSRSLTPQQIQKLNNITQTIGTDKLDELRHTYEEHTRNGGDLESVLAFFDKAVESAKLLDKETIKTEGAVQAIYNHSRSVEEVMRNEIQIAAGINKLDEEKKRHSEKELEYYNSRIKKIREGLTAEEQFNMWMMKNSENLGINTDKFKKGIDELKKGLKEAHDVAKQLGNPWIVADQAAADYTKRLGGTAESLKKMRNSIIDATRARHIGSHYNVSMEELAKMQSDYAANVGRKVNFTYGQQETIAAIHNVAGENGQTIAQNLENYGYDVEKSGKMLTDMFNQSSKKGVAFEKVAKNLQENIKIAQSYTFADGVKGVARMAERSAALKLNMQQTTAFAEKVSTLEGAMQAGASLSVLGGSFARNSNPLAMMYEGLNDAEGLQERTIRMIESLGHFDKTKNQLDVSAFNRMRIKQMAQATGMDYANLMESANAMGRRKEVENQIRGLYGGDKELTELVKNTAQLDENGRAYVTIDGEKRDVTSLTGRDKSQLRINANSQEDNIRDIAQNLRGTKEILEGLGKQRDSIYATLFETVGEGFKGVLKWIGNSNVLTGIFTSIPLLLNSINAAVHTTNSILLFKNSFGGIKGFNTPSMIGGKQQAIMTNGKQFPKNFRILNNGRVMDTDTGRIAGQASTIPTQAVGKSRLAKIGSRVGSGLGLGIAGVVGDYALEKGYEGERKGMGYALGKMGTRALEGAALGSMILPGWGTLLGAIGGAVVGGFQGFGAKEEDDLKARIESQTGYLLNGDYETDELEAILAHRVDGTLRSKMQSNGDLIPGYKRGGFVRRAYAKGTNRVIGKGTETSDSVPAMLSVGEAVVSSSNVKGNNLTISAINNGEKMDGRMMNIKKVAPNEDKTSNTTSKVSFEPMKIDISGTIKLELDGKKVEIDANQLLRNQQFINEIQKRIMAQMNFGFNKENARVKYSYPHK